MYCHRLLVQLIVSDFLRQLVTITTGSFRQRFLLSRTIRCRRSPSALVKLSHEWKREVMWSHCYASSMFQFPNVPQVERLRTARDHLFVANLQHACTGGYAVWLTAACVFLIAEPFFSRPA